MNHIIKLDTDWKPQKLPDLILRLKSISELHYTQRRSVQTGQLRYYKEYQKYEMPKTLWETIRKCNKKNV